MGYTTGHLWTETELDFIKQHINDYTNIELGEMFGVSKTAIDHKRQILGLKRSKKAVVEHLIKYIPKKERVVKNCLYCGKPLPPILPCHAKRRKFCNRSCGSKYMHKFAKHSVIKHRKEFGKRVANSPNRIKRLRERIVGNEEFVKNRLGEKHWNWRGGASLEPYPVGWTKTYKRRILERDNYKCQICHKKGKTVHHIDYNKKNLNVRNLITLCHSCHSRTNYDRDYWQRYFG